MKTKIKKPAAVPERSRPGSLGKLYDLLDAHFPAHRTRLGQLNIRVLSKELGLSTQAMYRWFSSDRLPARKLAVLIELSEGRLTYEKLAPYLF